MDPYLAEVLCNNLVSNALKHSNPDGIVKIFTSNKVLSISNQGSKALEHPEKLYSRFYRESELAKSTGLGLAIVHKICQLYHLEINYHFVDGTHSFTIRF